MSDETPRLKLPELVDGQEMDAMTINDALIALDAVTDIYLKGQFVNTPPSSPADGDTYLLGASPTGAWTGRAFKIAYCLDGGWRFTTPFNGLRVFTSTNATLIYLNGTWLDGAALLNAAETSLASAATCDLGAAAALFVTITGTTTITGLGTGANLLRFVRFAGALTLTHNASSLVLPGGANLTTATGDCAVFASDSSGNWRCRQYSRASGQPTATALQVTSIATGGATVAANRDTFSHAVTADAGNAVLDVRGASGVLTAQFTGVSGAGYNNANTAIYVGKDGTTGRSINAGGTLNASGADYAEYETKCEGCGTLAKGQVVGFDADGLLTDRWADAVAFAIKSSDPGLVGGDGYGAGLSRDDPDFAAKLEAARQRVDRIAYAGKVPVNVTGAAAGDVIVAAQDGDGIVGVAVAAPDFAQMRLALGRVRRVLDDGRAEVAVLVS